AAHIHCPANHVRRGAEPASPETMAEHHLVRIAAVCAECATNHRTAAQQAEEITVHPGVFDPVRLAADRKRRVGLPVHREVLERSTASFPIVEIRYAGGREPAVKSGAPQQSDAIRLPVWQGPQEDRIDDTEDRGACTD